MLKKYSEIGVGLFMLAGVIAFMALALKVSGFSGYAHQTPYYLSAYFDNIGGLKVRAPVRIAGVRVGEVTEITLDATTCRANVMLALAPETTSLLSTDTVARILTEGLLGANYVSLTPGFDKTLLKSGETIAQTHSALVLENMIGHLLFNLNAGKASKPQQPSLKKQP